LDEAFESPETAALRYEEGYEGGLLARADSPPGFLPMSAYGKPPPQSHGQLLPWIMFCQPILVTHLRYGNLALTAFRL
jgi:hypothetical protein